jgi:hypothetical protein
MKKLLTLLTFFSLNTMASTNNSLTLYFIPSPMGMDWSSPAKLAVSALKNRLSLKSRFMGHVFVELQCGDRRELTGMVGRNFDYLTQLLVKERGLGILFHSFDGRLEDAKDVQAEIDELSQKGERLNFVKFMLGKDHCERAITYIDEYRQKNVGKYYGLANRPLHGEGSGCSAFGASFAEVTGVLNEELRKAWSYSVNIPLDFAGPPLRAEGVNLLKLITNAGQWASDFVPHQVISFWDPDRMFRWVIHKSREQNGDFKLTELNRSIGLVFDRTQVPVPMGPIWKHLEANIKVSQNQ